MSEGLKSVKIIGVIEEIKLFVPRAPIKKVHELESYGPQRVGGAKSGSVPIKNLQFGPSLLTEVIRFLITEDALNQANVRMFVDRFGEKLSEEERSMIMEKYGVQIDKSKTEKKDGEKTAGANDPNVNVPKDPDAGTEPYEKEPEGGR